MKKIFWQILPLESVLALRFLTVFLKRTLLIVVLIVTGVFSFTGIANAAITQEAPPMDAIFENINVGGGAIIPLATFRLTQSSGSDTISRMGLMLIASSTISQGEISRVSLWQESGSRPGFQVDQDTFIGGAASTSPMVDGTLIVLTPTTPITVSTSGAEFYFVASTTAVSAITNGHAFNVALQENYASTTGGFGVGTAFSSNKKLTLYQSAPLKISEVKAGSTGNAGDEFIELYNTSETAINLQDLSLNLYILNQGGGAGLKSLTYYKKVIPARGFFLIASQTNYSGSVPPDAVYTTLSGNTLGANTGLVIATSSTITSATSTAIDKLGWGTEAVANCETSCATGDTALTENGSSLERVAVGYPVATSTAGSMMTGGPDASKGNSYDSNNNANDFILQTTVVPQNSSSAVEFPFGGGGFDMSSLQIAGSFPNNGMTNVPMDITYIGFGFNKTVATSTIISATATSTVVLVRSGNDPTVLANNLCTSITYNMVPGNFEPPAKCNLSAQLLSNTTYNFIATSSIYDLSGNALDQSTFTAGNQPYTASFTTGGASQTTTNVTPPVVIGTSPFPGSTNVPTNIAKIAIEFNQPNMKTSTLTSSNILLTGGGSSIALSNFSFGTSTGKNILTATLGSALTANTTYTISVTTSVQNDNNIAIPGGGNGAPYTSMFTTGNGADTSAPTVIGVLPTPATTIAANTNDFIFTFDDAISISTVNSSSVTLAISGGANLPGSVRYDPVAKEGHFISTNILPTSQTLVLTLVGSTIKNISDVALGSDVTRTWTVESSNSDNTPPSIMFANGDDFNLAITWNEAINATDAINLSNYTLVVGGVSQSLSSMAGHQLSYDASTRTVKLTGLRFTSGTSFTVTAQNIKDVSGNAMSTTSSFTGTIASYASSGGFVGPGSFEGTTFGERRDFSGAGIGFMPPVNIRAQNTFVSASSTYEFELPIANQISADGTIVITFPSSSDYNLCCVSTSTTKNPFINDQNRDINGFGAGTVGIKTITKDSQAKTVTLTLDTATRSENSDTHDLLRFSLVDVRNPSIPKSFDSSGYTLDIKSKNSGGTLLESFSGNPVFITGGATGGGATTTIQGTVTGNGGVLVGVNVHLMSPQTGPMDATTNNSGVYQFTNIPVGTQFLQNNFGGGSQFMLFTDPFFAANSLNDADGATSTAFYGLPMPTPVQATSTDTIFRNFALSSVSNANNLAVKMTAPAGTFTSTEQLDVFASGPNQFIVQTVTPGVGALSASTLATVPIPQTNGIWNVGIGPAMPKGGNMGMNSAPPSTTWSMPRPVEVVVSGCPGACAVSIGGVTASSYVFNVSVADKTISGVIKDGSGNAIAGAGVYAFSPNLQIGNQSQTSASGAFSIRVLSGSYNVGSFSPGIGQSKETPVNVDASGNVYVDGSPTVSTGSSGANPFVIKLSKPAYTITGRITDGSSSIGNAPVYAYRTDGPGHVDGMTDSSTGNYTLYVDSGTWKVGAFIPGFGSATEQTVTISSASRADINFAPSSGQTFSILSGNLYEDSDSENDFDVGEGISGAVIRLSGSSGTNEGFSGSDGAFSIRVPSGTNYQVVDVFKPNYGKIAPLKDDGTVIGAINLTASTTQNIKIPYRSTVTINIKDSDGNKIVVPKAFVDFFDSTTQNNNHIEITNASSTTIFIPKGSSPKVRVAVQGVPPTNISVLSDDAGTAVSSGVVTVNSNTEIIKVVVNTSTANLSTISGTVYHTAVTGGNELEGAWIQFVDETNGVFFGTQATTSGAYSIKAANGTYQVIANKPGFIGTPTTVTVSGSTSQNFVLTSASLTISGTVTAGGSLASDAFVRADKVGGGQVIGRTDTNGAYTLYVTSGTWRVYATAEGYAESAYSSNPVVVTSSVSGVTVALSTASSLQTKLATSNTFTDTSVGSLSDSTVGVEVNLDANALGASGSNSYLNAKETSNYPNTSSVNIIGSKAKEINAYNGSSKVTNLQSGAKATLELSYTKAELSNSGITSTSSVGSLYVVAYSDDKKDWENLSTVATYKDADGLVVDSPTSNLSNVSTVSFTAVTTHFSTFALSSPTGVEPPDTPTGLTASSGSAGSGQITLSWDAVSGAAGYYLYRDTSASGSFPLLTDASSATSYTNTGLSSATTYYYKVSAYKSGGDSESTASASVSASVAAAASNVGGGPLGGGGTTNAPTSNPTVIAQATPSGGLAVTQTNSNNSSLTLLVPSNTVSANTTFTLKSLTSEAVNPPSGTLAVGSVYEVYAELSVATTTGSSKVSEFSSPIRLRFHYIDSELPTGINEKNLKVFTRSDSGSKWNVINNSQIDELNNFVTATTTHLSQFAVMAEKVTNLAVETKQTVGTPTVEQVSQSIGSYNFTKTLKFGMENTDVASLQTFLEQTGFLVMPKGIAKGYFGKATEKALMAYQKSVSLEPVGILGPMTRKLINSLSDVPTSKKSKVETKGVIFGRDLKVGMSGNDVKALQEKLQTLGYYTYAEITGYFGEVTKKSVMAYQQAMNITPVSGYFGRLTRSQLEK